MTRGTLAARLAAWYALSASALLFGVTAVLYLALARSLEREDDAFLVSRARELVALVREGDPAAEELRREIARESGESTGGHTWIRVLDAAGRTLIETHRMRDVVPPAAFPNPAAERPAPHAWTAGDGRGFRVLAVDVPTSPPRRLQVALDCEQDAALLQSYRRRLWLLLALGVSGSVAAGYVLARHGLRPVENVTATARRIRSTALGERLATRGLPAEIAALALTFNEMLDRLEDSFARLSRFASDLAHELRTPVQNLRGEVEVALRRERSPEEYREILGSSLEELDRLSHLVEQLLFLARAEDPRSAIRRASVDVAAELARAAEFFEPSASEAGVALEVGGEPRLEASLDRALFQRALGNLLANALAHTPRGGHIRLTVTADPDEVRVEVRDDGRGIAPEHLPHVFERFYRADASRTSASGGLGLGLAIVQSIATLHGGRVEFESELGRGTCARILLPRKMTIS